MTLEFYRPHDNSATEVPANFKTIRLSKLPIPRLRFFSGSYDMTTYRILIKIRPWFMRVHTSHVFCHQCGCWCSCAPPVTIILFLTYTCFRLGVPLHKVSGARFHLQDAINHGWYYLAKFHGFWVPLLIKMTFKKAYTFYAPVTFHRQLRNQMETRLNSVDEYLVTIELFSCYSIDPS